MEVAIKRIYAIPCFYQHDVPQIILKWLDGGEKDKNTRAQVKKLMICKLIAPGLSQRLDF